MKAIMGLSVAGALASPVWANDSAAGIGVGGIELRQTDAVAMLSEDLTISPTEISIRYVFRNETDAPVTTLVAFPQPAQGLNSDMNYVNLPDPESDNYVGFETQIDGQRADLQVRHVATLDGRDRTDDLRARLVPLVPFDAIATAQGLAALPVETRDWLAREGFLTEDGLPRWSLQSTFWREQVFAPHQDVVVEHRYTPVAGVWLDSWVPGPLDPATDDDWMREGRAAARARYCIRPEDEDAMRAQLAGDSGLKGWSTFLSSEIGYILTTGANWRGPIERFTLTVESPSRWDFAFVCLEGAQRASQSRIDFFATDFVPSADLAVYFALARGETIDAP